MKQDDYKEKSTVTDSHGLYKTFKQKSKWTKVKKQTAVEWLWNLSKQREFDKFDFEQAKAMEKKQIEKAFVEGGVLYMANVGDDIPPKAKDYYNKKYKK